MVQSGGVHRRFGPAHGALPRACKGVSAFPMDRGVCLSAPTPQALKHTQLLC